MAATALTYENIKALTAMRVSNPAISAVDATLAFAGPITGFTHFITNVAAFTAGGGDRWVLKRLHPDCDLCIVGLLRSQIRTVPAAQIVAAGDATYLLTPYAGDRAAASVIPSPIQVANLLADFHAAVPPDLPVSGRHRWFDRQSILDGMASAPAGSHCQQTAKHLAPLRMPPVLTPAAAEARRVVCCHGDMRRSNLWRDADGSWSLWDIDGFCIMPAEYDVQRAIWGLALQDHRTLTPHWADAFVVAYNNRTGTTLNLELLSALLLMDTITASAWLATGLDSTALSGRTYAHDLLTLAGLVPRIRGLVQSWEEQHASLAAHHRTPQDAYA